MKKYFMCLVISFLLSGCMTVRKNELAPVEAFPKTRIDKRISVNITSECYTRGGNKTDCTDYKDDLLNTMEQSQLFRAVGVGEYYADYVVDIKYIHDDNYSIFMTLLTFVPSFGLIPKFRTDQFYITIDVTDKKTKKHKKTIITEDMLTVNELLLFPTMTTNHPVEQFRMLKKDILENVTVRIYYLIRNMA